jgi:endo-1,4-beta-xylanase
MGTFTVASAAAADEVILSNSFESGSFAPWGPRGGTTVAITAESGHDSAHSLSVTNRTANWNGTQASVTAMFAEGVVYQISGWVKLPVGTTISTGVKFTVQATPTAGGGDTFTQVNNPVTTDANTWVQIAGSYTRPAGLSSVILYVEAADDTAPFLVDDIQITGPSSTEIITVSSVDFEDGTIGNWTQSGGGAGLLTVVAGPTGGQVLSVNNRAADYEGIQSPTGIFEPNKTYSFSMKVRLAAGTAGSVGVRFVMKPAFTWIGPTNMNADGWTTVTGTWTAPSDGNPATLQVYIGTGDMSPVAPYTYLVDDILITTEGGGGGPELPPDFVPGGAVNPMPTPVNLAQGSGNVAALTFDDGPNPAITPQLLDYLASKNIKAVFCVIGQVINSGNGAEILRRIVAEGHTLCNHSTNFDDMGSLTAAQAQQRMIENMTIIRTALGDPNAKIPFFRAPNGSWGATQNVAVSLGMQPLAVVNTISDWVTQDIPTLTANLRAAMKPGELVLCHDGGGDRSGTFAAVQTVVNERLAAGWTFSFPQGTPPPAGQVAINTDFESGLGGWVPRDGGPGAPTVTISTIAHGGTGAALISNRPNQGAGLGHDAAMLRVGVTYELTAWLRFGDGLPTDEIWLTMQSNNGSGDSFATLSRFTGLTNTGYTKVTASFTMQPFQTAFLYFETRYQGGATGNTSDFLVDDILLRVPEPPVIQDLPALFSSTTFPIGVAIDNRETVGTSSSLLTRHFNQVTPENHMKPEAWYDADRNFRPHDQAIAIMDFAKNNNIRVYGHTLVWHNQTPAWFFQDASGNPLTNSAADQQILRDRLRTHINNVAQSLSTRYGLFGSATNPLKAFDVVNEVVSDGAESDGLRRSEWYRILGETYIDLAFTYAHEAFNGTYAVAGQDPVTLFINDYNTEQGGKQARYKALVERLLARGVPVQGVGHQFHLSLSSAVPTLDTALAAFDSLPVVQAVTEMDVTTGTPVTQANLIEQGYFYRDAFRIFRAHASKIFSVTAWGLIDGRSWRASSGAPLIFDNGYQAKPAYYGATDGTLPARLRTANVFAGDVPLNASATTSLEWKKLPLHAIESTGKFQLRWAPDHMTAFVSVNDATSNAGDKVYFTLNNQPYTVNRNGTGDVPAVAKERSGGYDIVAHLPLTSATQGSTATLDVQVTDDTTTTGWNTPGAVGTLSLIEALSYLEVNQARTVPVIDGAVDALWAADAGSVTTGKQVNGTGGATANVRTLWKNQTLYVLAEVTDPIIDLTGSDPWTKDSVEIYVDGGNFKNGPYRFDDTQIRINADNGVSFGTGDETFQRNRLVSATGRSATGYVVEAAISLLEYGGLGTFHGLDFQVNDASNGARTSIHNWADELGTGYQTTAHWGVGQLIGPRPIINLVAPSITGTPTKGNTLTANPGQWSVPGVTFTYQWQRDGVNIKKETGRTYKVKSADVDHQLRVIVTAHASGYDPVSVASAAVLATDKRCQRPLE